MEVQEEVKSSLLISDKHHPFVYLKIQLTFENGEEDVNELTPVQFKFLVMQAIKETLGEIGASTPVDILKLWDEGLAILRVPSIEAEKIWAALTLYSTTATQKKCAFRVLQASAFLLALSVNSRDLR
ncbi:ribonuclease P protein subunit p14 [Biomphalaria glabrata]|uniref:Ribonuclease P protein subunit p14-like n=1 Tax=Biomphalaria glabrata TaxID=6526 RepID=A0A2C9LWE3_BIOGL|nr:ribonuclease P protein subunit p14-like [Biomphalaria glabrata]XP_055882413.1 ribonuclease P protein subunit p14-like [Biomphalaria glabrata]XP_055882414.1 ribonuclease P protein subunit p14-like [Biomphalaria glabrata]XP_055882415.1 ribonuclease P protein subunit p14-like [Biomphalaria glabrata]XP_055882416.1 ribonuclease P protein subunit p14-like [Biomphalaria glabrata]KAI8735552.1 ribonuclease P protein subunit p14-like [Biomphalaria glabrata]